jgi:hypothetical protein
MNKPSQQHQTPVDTPTVYFLHIPKTAGTTLTYYLDQRFAHDEIFPAQLFRELKNVSPATLGQYRLFRGHFGYDLTRLLRTEPAIITILRDPVEHTLSHFAHWRRFADDYPPERQPIENSSLLDILNDQKLAGFLFNPQSYNVGGGMSLNSLRAENLNHEWMKCFEQLNLPTKNLTDPNVVLDRAKARLEEFACFGVVEMFDEFLDLLAYTFDWNPIKETTKQNVTPSRLRADELDQATLDKIYEFTVFDRELYEFACHRFKQRYRNMIHDLLERHRSVIVDTKPMEKASSLRVEFSEPIIGTGWYRFEPDNEGYRWTGPSNVSTLNLLLTTDQDLNIEFALISVISPEVLERFSLTVNGVPVELSVTGIQRGWHFQGTISHHALKLSNPFTQLAFKVSKTLTPIQVGWSETDDRLLGVAFDWLQLSPLLTVADGQSQKVGALPSE